MTQHESACLYRPAECSLGYVLAVDAGSIEHD